MKKIILTLAIVALTSTVSFAQTVSPLATVQAKKAAVENNLAAKQTTTQAKKAEINNNLEAKKAEIESKINARREENLARIDEQIAKAKEAGNPTDRLEQKRQKILERINTKQEELNNLINAQKAKLN